MSAPRDRARPASGEDVVPTAELVRRAGVTPFAALGDLHGSDPFGDDAEYEAFLADLYATRRSDVA